MDFPDSEPRRARRGLTETTADGHGCPSAPVPCLHARRSRAARVLARDGPARRKASPRPEVARSGPTSWRGTRARACLRVGGPSVDGNGVVCRQVIGIPCPSPNVIRRRTEAKRAARLATGVGRSGRFFGRTRRPRWEGGGRTNGSGKDARGARSEGTARARGVTTAF